MFRSHLREIRDRSVLRLFESNEVAAPQALPGGPGVPQPLPQQGGHWDQDQVNQQLQIHNIFAYSLIAKQFQHLIFQLTELL